MDLTKKVYFITSTVVDQIISFIFRLYGFIGFDRCKRIINAYTQDIRIANADGRGLLGRKYTILANRICNLTK